MCVFAKLGRSHLWASEVKHFLFVIESVTVFLTVTNFIEKVE